LFVSARRIFPLLCLVLALGLGSSASATTPGPNGRIVFSSSRDGNYELYSVNADGSALRRLTWTPAYEQAPSVSPVDGRITYERADGNNGGRFRIWVMNADGSGQTQVSSPGQTLDMDSDPEWSPDGKLIAFASTRAGTWNLWLMNADGSGARRISDVFASSVAWSPDGTQLAYYGIDGIGIVGLDGSNPHTVTAPGSTTTGPSWSPRGDQIVFSRSSGGYPGELYVVNVDGSGERQLTSGGYKNALPSWSPDGSQIVYQRDGAPSGYHLWTIGADGSGARQISSGEDLAPDWGSSQAVPEPVPPQAPTIQILSPTDGSVFAPGIQPGYAYYLCTSYVSYIVSCRGDVPLGAPLDLSFSGTHTFTVRATDAEGRTASLSVTYTVIDLVAPVVDIRTPADGASYDLGAAVRIDYSCTDPGGSGVAACVGDRPNGAPLDTASTGTHTFTVFAGDNVGNFRQKSVTYSVVGRPQVHLATPSDGATYELGSTVLADYSCSAAPGTQLASCAAPVAAGSSIDTSSAGTKAFTVTAADDTGPTVTVTHTYKVVGPPQIEINSPADGATYTLGATALATYACSSPWGVPLVTCSGSVANQSPLDTGSIGAKTFTASATDQLGGNATSTRTYNIIYAFTGFDSPVSTTGTLDGVKAGEAIPLKFSLQGNRSIDVVSQITWQTTTCTDWSPLGTASAGQGKLTYSASSDRYTELVTTDPTSRGSCRSLDLRLTDGTHHTVNIRFNK
jgi:hypothetical protein